MLWMPHMDPEKMHKEQARRPLHKNTVSYIEQILEKTHYETTAVRPLTYRF